MYRENKHHQLKYRHVRRRKRTHWDGRTVRALYGEVTFVRGQHGQGLPRWLSGKESACNVETQETQVHFLGQEDPLEEEMAIHSSILAWKIPWTEEPGGLQSLGLQRVRHDLATEHKQ